MVALIIITIGASIFLRGVAQIVFDKQFHRCPPSTGDTPFHVLGATPAAAEPLGDGRRSDRLCRCSGTSSSARCRQGDAGHRWNRLARAARRHQHGPHDALSFALSAALGALAGVLITPITFTSYDVGTLLALKGFAAAMLGGMGNPSAPSSAD